MVKMFRDELGEYFNTHKGATSMDLREAQKRAAQMTTDAQIVEALSIAKMAVERFNHFSFTVEGTKAGEQEHWTAKCDVSMKEPEPVVAPTVPDPAYPVYNYLQNIENALLVISNNAMLEGAHHKAWVISQVVRELLGSQESYEMFVQRFEVDTGSTWDEGSAP